MNPLARITLALLALAAPTQAWAQSRALSVGEEVRVRWDLSQHSFAFAAPQRTIAKVVGYDGTSLLLRRGNHLISVPTSSIRTVERRVGTKPASAPAMVIGSGLGFVAGFAAGTLVGYADPTLSGQKVIDRGISAGVLLGAPLGALLAWASSRQRGIYERVGFGDMVTGVVIDPGGQVGLSLSVSRR